MAPTAPSADAGPARTSWHVALFGALKRTGAWQVPARMVFVAVVGGVELDLSSAQLTSSTITVTKVSLIGGVAATVPAGMRVDVQGASLVGGRHVEAREDPAGVLLRIRSFSLVGGVAVRTR